MGEWKITEYNAGLYSSTKVEAACGADAVATYDRPGFVYPAGNVRVNYSSVGSLSIADAKAFHAALGKAIEIAEGYQRELESGNDL